jgi:hypothetical protein
MRLHNIDQIRFGITDTVNKHVPSMYEGLDAVVPSNKYNNFDAIHNIERYCNDTEYSNEYEILWISKEYQFLIHTKISIKISSSVYFVLR